MSLCCNNSPLESEAKVAVIASEGSLEEMGEQVVAGKIRTQCVATDGGILDLAPGGRNLSIFYPEKHCNSEYWELHILVVGDMNHN